MSNQSCFILSLDAPLEGRPVSVASETVRWEGVDLLKAGVIWLECPIFPWPQPHLDSDGPDAIDACKRTAAVRREAQSLAVSAVSAAAETVRVVNHPAFTHLAVSPVMALDLLAREGFEVHDWSLESVARHAEGESMVLDVAGRDRRHSPGHFDIKALADIKDPACWKDPVLSFEPFSSDAGTFLIVGEKIAGGLHHPGQPWWTARDPVIGSVPESASLAVRAARTLGLDMAAVSMRIDGASSAILFCDAAPDFAAWDRKLDGSVAAALADYLTLSVKEIHYQ